MSYRVLALKYRPQTFADVLGQTHVTTTLTNAISSNRVAHAILFTGPRGTGKTTIARILAKAMNCMEGPTAFPCNICKSCTSITSGNAVDVFEIDGASNNSVDQIRELRENVTYMPSSSKFKIYIIDEVHMLSTAAFNALLKTLEEPPDHVLFIFATTEVHKIPVTILSRCQRHDLGRISLAQISDHLEKLSTMEGFTIPRESCDLMASEADGSMRDSLSLLDRILSSSDKKEISHEEILNNLGIIDKALIFGLAEAIIKNDGAAVLDLVDRVHDLGLDLKRFYASLILHFRNLAVMKIFNQEREISDISHHDRTRMAALTAPLTQVFLNQILNILLSEESLVKLSSHTKTAVEMVLLKLIQIRPGMEIDEIIQRLDKLARRFDNPDFKEPENPQVLINSRLTPPPTPYPKELQQEPDHANLPPLREEQEPFKPLLNNDFSKEPGKGNQDFINPPPQKNSAQTNLDPSKNWNALLKTIGKSQPLVSAILSKAHLQNISDTDIAIELNGTSFDLGRIETKRAELESICSDFYGKKLRVRITGDCAPKTIDNDEKSPARMRQEVLNHPLVADTIKLFNGLVVEVKSN